MKRNAYHPEEYLFMSSAIRARELSLIPSDRLRAMAMARSDDELRRMIEEYGISPETNEYGEVTYEPALRERLCQNYQDIIRLLGDPSPLAILLYPYDCNNIKTLIKGELIAGDITLPLLPLGSVSIEDATAAVRLGMTDTLPHRMAEAIAEAKSAYAKVGSPQMIDLILDRACFEDIKEATELSGIPFLSELLALTADTLNALTALRMMRLGSPSPEELMETAFLCGGTVPCEVFAKCLHGTEAQYTEVLTEHPTCRALGTALLDASPTLSSLEHLRDALIMDKLRATKPLLSGIEIAAAYLYAVEYEVKDLRIILSARGSGMSGDKILERLRESYV